MGLTLGQRLARTQPWLEQLGESLQPKLAELIASRPWLHDLLDGTWLGTPLHPALTDIPVGSWTAAFVLDGVAVTTRSQAAATAADGALAVGIAGALPAAATGASDWRDLIDESRRIGLLHGLLNSLGLTLNVASLGYRLADRRGRARLLSGAGLLVSSTAAHIGGELSFGLGIRVNHTYDAAAPEEFADVLAEDALGEDEMTSVTLGGTPVLLTRSRSSGQLCAIAHRCSHLGGPLSEGDRDGDIVTCPWHGSRFDLRTGEVMEGPAVFSQPRYEARIEAGQIQLRAARE